MVTACNGGTLGFVLCRPLLPRFKGWIGPALYRAHFLSCWYARIEGETVTSPSQMVVDSRFPWKLPRECREFSTYPYRMSVTEWKALLARAERGNAEAEWEVAEHFEDGCKDKKGRILVRRSARNAAKWLRRAAEHGCASAQNNLGVLLGDRKYADRDPCEALVWLERAFRAGEHLHRFQYRDNPSAKTAISEKPFNGFERASPQMTTMP